ncbi:glycosyltransferase [Pseudanabaena sp. PCC 6802]|uniref:glycosyltransferase n=1 Tax=Pseudanabaena sp. PCC 6802 TaxID=118173 RepID=UPI00036BED9A|nr:glycosyltransferase [Pseudanabaena sp. PCC 6802]
MTDSFSIIVPAFNCERVVSKTLTSIAESINFFKQHYARSQEVSAEIVIVNDASTDNTLSLLKEFADRYVFVKIVSSNRNRGASVSRNIGVRYAQGEILFFCDADDLFLPEHIYVCFMLLQGRSEGISSFPLISENYNLIVSLPEDRINALRTGVRIKDKIHPQWTKAIRNSIPLNLCVRRECHEFIEGFPEDEIYTKVGTEDLTYQVALSTFYKIDKIDIDTVEYVRYPGNNLDKQLAKFKLPPGEYQGSLHIDPGLLREVEDARQQRILYLRQKHYERSHQSEPSQFRDRSFSRDVIIITGADTKFFELAQGTIRSIRDKPQGKDVAIGFLDLGCTAEEIRWLQDRVDIIKQPVWDFDFPNRERSPEYLKGLLARPFLRQYFPNFDIYLWIDADAWVQDWYAIELFIQGANRKGLAIVPELDRCSNKEYGGQVDFQRYKSNHYKSFFGNSVAEKLCTYPMLNAGVFALRCDAPHWQIWESLLRQGLQNCANFLTDQFALNFAIYEHGLLAQTEFLPGWCNWLLLHGLPMLDSTTYNLVETYLPHVPIGILHLAGGYKQFKQLKLSAIAGGIVAVNIRYPEFKQQRERVSALQDRVKSDSLPSGDYISQGFVSIYPDLCLPNIAVSNSNASDRSYQHNRYFDRRHPGLPLLSRDEALILYNIALQYKGRRGLAIGAQMGWTLCHMAIVGLELDVLDSMLGDKEVLQSIKSSIDSAKEIFGTISQVTLVPGDSSQVVEELGNQLQRRWSTIFIDSSFDRSSVRHLAIVCERYAEPDATILFANASVPEVVASLNDLKNRGWQTTIYQTLQGMAVAWRGNIQPIKHYSDPKLGQSVRLPTAPVKHILLCTGDRGVGGVAKYNHSLLCALAERGYKVTCVQPHAVDTDAVNIRQQLGVRHLWLDDRQTQAELNRIFNTSSERPHLIISSNTSPFSNLDIQSTAIEFDIPYIIVEGLVMPEYIQRETPERIKQLARHYSQAKQTIAVSTENLNLLHQQFGLPRDRGRVIYYGRPPQYFTPRDLANSNSLRQSLQIPHNAIVCFTSARIEVRKGYHYQLEAIQALIATPVWERLYFVWAGGGIFRPQLEAQLKEALEQLGISNRVKFLGQVQDVAEWIDLADIFILPSQNEGMPLSVIEAMAKGIAIIATAVGGIPEALGNTGRLISDPKTDPQRTVTELVLAIQELAAQLELRDRLGRDAKQRAEQLFSEERMLEETIAEIQTAIAETVGTSSGR